MTTALQAHCVCGWTSGHYESIDDLYRDLVEHQRKHYAEEHLTWATRISTHEVTQHERSR